MPHRRRVRKGSFAAHFDELVAHFPVSEGPRPPKRTERNEELQEKIDIHALLFDRAWKLDDRR
ncbi:MAG TPA: hypothetical protein VHE36_02100 [Sphingomicrobium sp.]|nr:hypothetical protein [Sphingomicrobium sp.]